MAEKPRENSSRVTCPHCGHTMRKIRTKVHSKLIKDVILSCPNRDCEAVLGMMQEIYKTIKPSHDPNDEISEELS